jgi:ubiquinone/menaquinone biosynthesis C-methylase UbiE
VKRAAELLFVFAAAAGFACAQVAKEANDQYQSPEARSHIAASLTEPGRDARQKPKALVAALGIKPGMSVADVGTGAGYMLPWLSAAAGADGTVYAEDIFPDFLEKAKANSTKLKNVKFIQGNEKSVSLPAGTIDVALILDAYHHFNYPEAMLASVRQALKPGGRLAVVEYHKNKEAMAGGRALTHIRASRDEFVKEIEANGFRAVEVRDFNPEVQWIGIFEPK